MNLNDCYLIGSIVKTHGNRGELILKFDNNLFFETTKELVFIDIDGELVPFFIYEYIQRTSTTAIVKFDYIDDFIKAKEFVDCNIYIPKKDMATASQNIVDYDIIGYNVVDKHFGKVGEINEVIDIKNNPLLVILRQEKEILFPFNEKFIEKIDEIKGVIEVDMPEGLIDLYL
ncbi:MAG: 16S rRNA processing protein RimM [Bacteroidetes bacterium]|nr:MAG: 16S rRNA processing protein RimM [Bacteroidota bacterium]